MSMNGPTDPKEKHGSHEHPTGHDSNEVGHTGEGAASAMAHMIYRAKQQRHPADEADAAGSQHP
jgi:hypothetical protein